MDNILRNTLSLNTNQVKQIIDDRERLNTLIKKSRSLEEDLLGNMPKVISSATLSQQHRREIIGLHSSGLYTQQQLADQYGVTQSAISQCVKMKANQNG